MMSELFTIYGNNLESTVFWGGGYEKTLGVASYLVIIPQLNLNEKDLKGDTFFILITAISEQKYSRAAHQNKKRAGAESSVRKPKLRTTVGLPYSTLVLCESNNLERAVLLTYRRQK